MTADVPAEALVLAGAFAVVYGRYALTWMLRPEPTDD